MLRAIFYFTVALYTQNALSQSLQFGIDLMNSLAIEYHLENKIVGGLELPFGSEKTNTVNYYGTRAKLEYSPGIRIGWEAVTLESSKGFIFLSMSSVKGDGTVTVSPANPEKSTSGESIAFKYNHRWYWPNFALGVGGGYRHNTITNVLVPYASQTFDIKLEQAIGPVFGEVSLYLVF